jgi:hypothetical protein
MSQFPIPDGISREFMRSFGIFPVVLVNSSLQLRWLQLKSYLSYLSWIFYLWLRQTNTQELFPIHNETAINVKESTSIDVIVPASFSQDVDTWTTNDCCRWLRIFGLESISGMKGAVMSWSWSSLIIFCYSYVWNSFDRRFLTASNWRKVHPVYVRDNSIFSKSPTCTIDKQAKGAPNGLPSGL